MSDSISVEQIVSSTFTFKDGRKYKMTNKEIMKENIQVMYQEIKDWLSQYEYINTGEYNELEGEGEKMKGDLYIFNENELETAVAELNQVTLTIEQLDY